jgi:hypothetical protein
MALTKLLTGTGCAFNDAQEHPVIGQLVAGVPRITPEGISHSQWPSRL